MLIREAVFPVGSALLKAVSHEYIGWFDMDLFYCRGVAQEMVCFEALFKRLGGLFLLACGGTRSLAAWGFCTMMRARPKSSA